MTQENFRMKITSWVSWEELQYLINYYYLHQIENIMNAVEEADLKM